MAGRTRDQWGSRHWNWKGGRKLLEGYVAVYRPDHPRASKRYVLEHRLVVECVLGHLLPVDAVVHHVNDTKIDNRTDNLVALENLSEHMALHMRRRVLRAGGNPWTQRLCTDCGPRDFDAFKPGSDRAFSCRCRDCRRANDRKQYQAVGREHRRQRRAERLTAQE